jgi:NH3-dependent NAD+ synthetase
VPADARRRDERCNEVYNIQVQALAQRLTNSGLKKVVIGVSGGLDSTHALLVCARVMDKLNCRAPISWPTPCRALPPASARSSRRMR